MSTDNDVIVIGAGLAGLAAARVLAEAGLSVTVVEARDRAGGRILTLRPDGGSLPVELGAEFVHGRPPELLALIEEAGLTTFELDGEDVCDESGALGECSQQGAFALLEKLDPGVDLTFSEFLKEHPVPEEVARRAVRYVEGFNAADANRIGTAALAFQQRAEDEIDGSRAFRIEEGNDRLPAYLAERFTASGGRLLLSHSVSRIDWRRGGVRMEAGSERLEARRAVITVPLGVLHARTIRFHPEPRSFLSAAGRMAMGTATRITLDFAQRFWARRFPEMSFLFSQNHLPSVWWTTWPRANGLLTGWVGGPQTKSIHPGTLREQALGQLGEIFGESSLREHLAGSYLHDWQQDAFSLGAYSYAPRGALHASREMTEPVESTLFFAGEHTDVTGHWGTLHGALRSGLRAAAQVLAERG